MNIDDVDSEINVPENIIAEIFTYQTELMNKYHVIEKKNGIPIPEAPWHIDNHLVQYRIKDFLWRTTEEVCEALEVAEYVRSDWKSNWDTDANIRHFFEEISDSLHFLVEASIYAGLDNSKIEKSFNDVFNNATLENIFTKSLLFEASMDFILFLGLAANTLKNKPWKVTSMSTDIGSFHKYLYLAWAMFFHIWADLLCTKEDVYILYYKKNKINQWRQKTQY